MAWTRKEVNNGDGNAPQVLLELRCKSSPLHQLEQTNNQKLSLNQRNEVKYVRSHVRNNHILS